MRPTILPEIIHTCGGGEREAYACEKRFFEETCKIRVPAKYRPKTDCEKPCG